MRNEENSEFLLFVGGLAGLCLSVIHTRWK